MFEDFTFYFSGRSPCSVQPAYETNNYFRFTRPFDFKASYETVQNWRPRQGRQYDYSQYDDPIYGAASGHGDDCCPLVVDPLTLFALLGFLVAATYFLWVAITMNVMGGRRRRRKRNITKHFPISSHINKNYTCHDNILNSGYLLLNVLVRGFSCTNPLSEACQTNV